MSEETFVDITKKIAEFDVPIEGFSQANDPFSAPLLPEGKYQVRLTFAEKDPAKRWTPRKYKENHEFVGRSYLSTKVEAEITEGQHKGRKLTDRFVATFFQRGGTKVAGVAFALGAKVKDGASDQEQAVALTHALEKGGQCFIEVIWECQFSEKNGDELINYPKETLRGATSSKWPKDDQGNPETDITMEIDGHEVKGYVSPTIQRYSPLKA